mmetsp:Transcript_51553/g.77119  ORF Transcript_51553/g.77119 Transcript_51553/m.77119 type:complete len:97 (+) Transcript_51553:470-760(+)
MAGEHPFAASKRALIASASSLNISLSIAQLERVFSACLYSRATFDNETDKRQKKKRYFSLFVFATYNSTQKQKRKRASRGHAPISERTDALEQRHQ